METTKQIAEEIYEKIGSGYGFNGKKEDAINIIESKVEDLVKYYSEKAFVAGRSKTTWKTFYVNNFLTP